MKIIDFFCGIGGLSLGFEQAGYDVLAGIDVWKDALITYQANHKHSKAIQADLMNLSRRCSQTIDTGHRHHFYYLHNRIPTARESARIQIHI